jgi:hypothetical protein
MDIYFLGDFIVSADILRWCSKQQNPTFPLPLQTCILVPSARSSSSQRFTSLRPRNQTRINKHQSQLIHPTMKLIMDNNHVAQAPKRPATPPDGSPQTARVLCVLEYIVRITRHCCLDSPPLHYSCFSLYY